MKILTKQLKPEDVSFLNDPANLYSTDFRAISENMNYTIKAMWKYENLVPWVVADKNVLVNEDYQNISYRNKNKYLVTRKDESPRCSIYKRTKYKLGTEIKRLWVAIPHPDADKFAKVNNLHINYKYKEFLEKNNKIVQKNLFGDLSPDWEIIETKEHLNSIIEGRRDGYIKREEGSGGFTVFDVNSLKTNNKKFNKLYEDNYRWYFEEKVSGYPCSIQCVSEKDTIVIFGFTQQLIEENRYFYGSEIVDLHEMDKKIENQIHKALERISPLLKDYEGFFGIDFFVDKDKGIHVLEANIRLTAATIPTLLNNVTGLGGSIYKENIKKSSFKEDAIILTKEGGEYDILKFKGITGSIGKYSYLELGNCNNIPKKIRSAEIKEVQRIIEESVSEVLETSFYNFWPFGWTVSYILKDSHTSISSWYLEKRVTIDVFSCGNIFKPKKFKEHIRKYFDSKKVLKFTLEKR